MKIIRLDAADIKDCSNYFYLHKSLILSLNRPKSIIWAYSNYFYLHKALILFFKYFSLLNQSVKYHNEFGSNYGGIDVVIVMYPSSFHYALSVGGI